MSKPEILAAALLLLFAVFFGRSLLSALFNAMRRPRAVTCAGAGCGAQIHPSRTRCAACVGREDAITAAWAEIELSESKRARALDAERREAERIASRAEVVTIGSVTVDPHGSVTFDGWNFALPGAEPGQVIPIAGRISRDSLIAGWRQSELHALAHGGHCSCLARMGAWVR